MLQSESAGQRDDCTCRDRDIFSIANCQHLHRLASILPEELVADLVDHTLHLVFDMEAAHELLAGDIVSLESRGVELDIRRSLASVEKARGSHLTFRRDATSGVRWC